MIAAWALATAAVVYPVAAARRGPWPWHRTACWIAGLAAILAAGPLLDGGFTAHAAGHLLLGMVAPLLLVLSAPVTLALRALPVRRARVLSAVLRRTRLLTWPPVAAVLDVGGLWLVYTTDLHTEPLVQVHVLAAGYLFTASIVGVDPMRHRASWPLRAATLVLASAAHGILAKQLYPEHPAGAMLMYYGGDAVEIALVVLLCREWLLRRGVLARRAGGPQHPQVEHGEQAADHGEQPHPAHGRGDGEGGRAHGQHEEGDAQAAGHRSADRAVGHAGHAAIPRSAAATRSATRSSQCTVYEANTVLDGPRNVPSDR